MRHPAVRWFVLAVAVLTAAGCCYWAARLEQRALDRRRLMAVAATDARGLQSALSDTRRALSAMASPGQAAVSWSRQATASIETARARLAALMTSDGGASLRQHAERLDKLADAEARLHDNAVSGRALMASDVAFGEALPHVDALDHEVAESVSAMIAAADQDLAATRDQQIMALAGALGVLGVAAVLLTPAPKRDGDAAGATAAVASSDVDSDVPALPSPPSPAIAAAAARSPAVAPVAAAPAPLPVSSPARVESPRVDLPPLALACDALARLSDGTKLSSVLDSVRPALSARGVTVWLVDAAGATLQVVASSGYDARVVERFPLVTIGDDNPTARAYSRRAAVTLPARGGQPAAIAVPIGGARGTTGVLSLEMAGMREATGDVVAAAGIVAAQLSALLEPLPAPVAEPVEEPTGDSSVSAPPLETAPAEDDPANAVAMTGSAEPLDLPLSDAPSSRPERG